MLFRLLLFRMSPIAAFRLCKSRRQMKMVMIGLILCYGFFLITAIWKMIAEKSWQGIFYVPLSMFPHYICYGFAGWILIRCIWHAWSKRVWKRIYLISVVSVFVGIIMENYWNPKVLQFFYEILK